MGAGGLVFGAQISESPCLAVGERYLGGRELDSWGPDSAKNWNKASVSLDRSRCWNSGFLIPG